MAAQPLTISSRSYSQELQQESSRQQLLSPLPFPTMIPLLSASVANNKTVVMDPVRHLQATAHDLLQVVAQQVWFKTSRRLGKIE